MEARRRYHRRALQRPRPPERTCSGMATLYEKQSRQSGPPTPTVAPSPPAGVSVRALGDAGCEGDVDAGQKLRI